MFTKDKFKKCSVVSRCTELKGKGEHLASRIHGSFNVSLFSYNGYYVELWKRLSLEEVVWVEVVESITAIEMYTDHLDLDLNSLFSDS